MNQLAGIELQNGDSVRVETTYRDGKLVSVSAPVVVRLEPQPKPLIGYYDYAKLAWRRICKQCERWAPALIESCPSCGDALGSMDLDDYHAAEFTVSGVDNGMSQAVDMQVRLDDSGNMMARTLPPCSPPSPNPT